jgi:hypothetical protein
LGIIGGLEVEQSVYDYSPNWGQPSAVQVMGRWMSMAAPFCVAL